METLFFMDNNANGYSLATFLLLLQYVWKEAGSHCCLYDIKDINISTDSHRMVRHCILFLLIDLQLYQDAFSRKKQTIFFSQTILRKKG